MSAGALAKALARLDEPQPATAPKAPETADAPPELPTFVRRYAFGPWRFVAPRVRMRPIHLPEPSPTRVFLLKVAADTTLLAHEHTALEMTCVLRGAFRHAGGRYGPGDFRPRRGDGAARAAHRAGRGMRQPRRHAGRIALEGFLGPPRAALRAALTGLARGDE